MGLRSHTTTIQTFLLDDFPLHVRLYNRRGQRTGDVTVEAPDLDPVLLQHRPPLTVDVEGRGTVVWAVVHTARGEQYRLLNERVIINDELILTGLAVGLALATPVLLYLLNGEALPVALWIVFVFVAVSLLAHLAVLGRRRGGVAGQPWVRR
jgi:hypothetical protein